MQNLEIKNNYLFNKNKNQIKKMWLGNFQDDTENVVDNFLENVFKNKKGVGAFLNNELIAMILFLNSKIIIENKKINAVYYYCVCTDVKYRNKGIMKSLFDYARSISKEQGYEISFLVPANEGLFTMYEKLSFSRAIGYEEKAFFKESFDDKNTLSGTTDFCYRDYKKLKTEASRISPVVFWDEDEFNFIFNKNRKDVSFFFSESGYAIYEKQNDGISVLEACGDENGIAASIFNKEKDCKIIKMRLPGKSGCIDFGMTLNLIETTGEVNAIYFGMPYG